MKKQWISVKCGLSRDPKHRQAMGEGVWLFLHILDIASWDDGIAHDWKDEAAAEEMGMPVRTLREHRRKLDELGYISCVQKQYTQDIIIHNWTNPREYNGKVYNEKQSGSETSPQENEQGYTQGYTQGSRKDVTPTLDSNNKESIGHPLSEQDINQVNSKVDYMIGIAQQADALLTACQTFEMALFGSPVNWPWSSNAKWQKFAKWCAEQEPAKFTEYATWRKGDGKFHAMSNNKIRQDPQMFMDTGWPTFLAHSSMYGSSNRDKGFAL